MYDENYDIYSNNKGADTEYNTKKIVLNDINDLMNIPIQQLRTAQLKNFCGNLFEQLYQEAMAIEHNQEIKTENKFLTQEKKMLIKKKEDKNIKNGGPKPIFYKLTKKVINKSKDNTRKKNNIEKVYGNKLKSSSVERNKIKKIIKKKVKKSNKSLNDSDLNEKMNSSLNGTSKNKNINSYKTKNKINNMQEMNSISHFNHTNINQNNLSQSQSNPYFSPINNNINNNNENIEIKKITFSLKYDTTFGEEIGILGSIPNLGNWNQNEIFYLKWNTGNIWTGEINSETNPFKDFEFKFVISSNRNVKKWESGDNNKVIFDKLISEIKYKKKGFFNKYEYMYDKGELYIKCKWE